jgi:hypothetical protein
VKKKQNGGERNLNFFSRAKKNWCRVILDFQVSIGTWPACLDLLMRLAAEFFLINRFNDLPKKDVRTEGVGQTEYKHCLETRKLWRYASYPARVARWFSFKPKITIWVKFG